MAESFTTKLKHPLVAGPLILLALTCAMFGDVLLSPSRMVLSDPANDVASLFLHWRAFGLREVSHGNLPLWNPHVLSGYPFFANFQSALLYPPNAIYLVLRLDKAINLDIALHVFLTGFFMYLWALQRDLRPAAALLTECLLMFGGPFFLHVYAGHLTALAAMAWTPLLFLVCDGLLRKPSLRWCLLGAFGVAMQVLAGYPQHVFYTAIAIGLYVVARGWRTPHGARAVAGVAAFYGGGAALSAVQIVSGLAAARGSIRGGGAPYEMASMFALPPENFLTLLAPGFFGDMANCAYWGRCFLWEMSLFMGVAGFALAMYGAVAGTGNARRGLLPVMAVLYLLALGSHTPLFKVLYTYFPGFNSFRSNSKFIYEAAVPLALLAGIGWDKLLENAGAVTDSITRRMAIALGVMGIGIVAAGLWIQHSAARGVSGAWGKMMAAVAATGESYLAAADYRDAEFIKEAGDFAAHNLFLCAGLLIPAALLFIATASSKKAPYVLMGLAILEIFSFARLNRPAFDLAEMPPNETARFLAAHRGDDRFVKFSFGNEAMTLHAQDIGGYDPYVSRRYAEFIAFTQHRSSNAATEYLQLARNHRLYRMLRCRYVFIPEGFKTRIEETKDVLPRLQLVRDWTIITGRDRIFAAMSQPSFDPRRQVILETMPAPAPIKTSAAANREIGAAHVVEASTDHLTIEADLAQPAILLVTDNYSDGWRAVALAGSAQREYQVLPANYILRAIPLNAGHHRLRLEYAPLAFRVGRAISLVSLALYLALLVWHWRKRGRRESY